MECSKCQRLVDFLGDTKKNNPDYYCKPVPSFGDENAKLLIVGLAPGMHGANATGRPFTGDYAGALLYETLYKFNFSTATESRSSDDGLVLKNCRITNAVRCLPPQNKPLGEEVNNCNAFLLEEIARLQSGSVIIALGQIAHKAIIKALGKRQKDFPFGHAACFDLNENLLLIDSYHCSRYNTQTRRLTKAMFEQVFDLARQTLNR